MSFQSITPSHIPVYYHANRLVRVNIALCGATGFIGKISFLPYEIASYSCAFWHKTPPFQTPIPVNWIECDFLNPSSFSGCFDDVDLVLQFAAVTSGAKDIVQSPHLYVTSNAIINSNILHEFSSSKNHLEAFNFPSCSIVYPSSLAPAAENSVDYNLIHPVYFGAAHTKLYIEKQIEFFARNNCFSATVIRHSNVYGPHDKFFSLQGHVLSSAFSKILKSESTVEIWGDGSSLRDLIYIDDFIEFIKLFLNENRPSFGIFNCGRGIWSLLSIFIDPLLKSLIAPPVFFSTRRNPLLTLLFSWIALRSKEPLVGALNLF